MQAGAITRETISAGFVERFLAFLIDALILAIPNAILTAVVGGTVGYLLSTLLGAAYAIYFWTKSGQTPGKNVMKLKVVKADGGAILAPGEAVLRYVGMIISSIPFGLGFLWIIWDPRHEGWHDKIAGTKVIKVEQSAPLL